MRRLGMGLRRAGFRRSRVGFMTPTLGSEHRSHGVRDPIVAVGTSIACGSRPHRCGRNIDRMGSATPSGWGPRIDHMGSMTPSLGSEHRSNRFAAPIVGVRKSIGWGPRPNRWGGNIDHTGSETASLGSEHRSHRFANPIVGVRTSIAWGPRHHHWGRKFDHMGPTPTVVSSPSPLRERGWGEGQRSDDGEHPRATHACVASLSPQLLASPTPHPPFGHLLPEGEGKKLRLTPPPAPPPPLPSPPSTPSPRSRGRRSR